MSQPEHEAIVNQIRSAQIAASPELRARVRAIAARSPAAPPSPPRAASCRGGGRSWCWRRPPSRSRSPRRSPSGSSTPAVRAPTRIARPPSRRRPLPFTGPASDTVLPARVEKGGATSGGGASTSAASAGNLPATPGRAQLYDAELTLKIKDLSTATKQRAPPDARLPRLRAQRRLRLRHRAWLGVPRPARPGRERPGGDRQVLGARPDPRPARLDPGRPAARSTSGSARCRRSATRSRSCRRSSRASRSPPIERTALDERARRARSTRSLVLQKQATALARQTSYATVELDLRQGEKAVVVPHEPSRIGRALHRSGQILVDEAKVLVYVLVVGAPFLALLGARRRWLEDVAATCRGAPAQRVSGALFFLTGRTVTPLSTAKRRLRDRDLHRRRPASSA